MYKRRGYTLSILIILVVGSICLFITNTDAFSFDVVKRFRSTVSKRLNRIHSSSSISSSKDNNDDDKILDKWSKSKIFDAFVDEVTLDCSVIECNDTPSSWLHTVNSGNNTISNILADASINITSSSSTSRASPTTPFWLDEPLDDDGHDDTPLAWKKKL